MFQVSPPFFFLSLNLSIILGCFCIPAPADLTGSIATPISMSRFIWRAVLRQSCVY
jgi:hypothetical protein